MSFDRNPLSLLARYLLTSWRLGVRFPPFHFTGFPLSWYCQYIRFDSFSHRFEFFYSCKSGIFIILQSRRAPFSVSSIYHVSNFVTIIVFRLFGRHFPRTFFSNRNLFISSLINYFLVPVFLVPMGWIIRMGWGSFLVF